MKYLTIIIVVILAHLEMFGVSPANPFFSSLENPTVYLEDFPYKVKEGVPVAKIYDFNCVWEYHYNLKGMVVKEVEYCMEDTTDKMITLYNYDELDRLASTIGTNKEEVIRLDSMKYDSKGNLIRLFVYYKVGYVKGEDKDTSEYILYDLTLQSYKNESTILVAKDSIPKEYHFKNNTMVKIIENDILRDSLAKRVDSDSTYALEYWGLHEGVMVLGKIEKYLNDKIQMEQNIELIYRVWDYTYYLYRKSHIHGYNQLVRVEERNPYGRTDLIVYNTLGLPMRRYINHRRSYRAIEYEYPK